ncbi:MAG TPA: vWA domain-containing protein [Kofleriaceae bacterium]
MVVLDKSSSMETGMIGGQSKWSIAVNGLGQLLDTYQAKAEFGLMTYPQPNQCGPGALDVAPALSNKTAIMGELTTPPPTSGNYTPMSQTLDVAAELPNLQAAAGPRHLVLITDGWQYCVPYDPATRYDGTAGVEKLKTAGVTTWIVGFGAEVDASALNRMAVAAATTRPNCNPNQTDSAATDNCYFQVDNQQELMAALTQIAGSASAEVCDGQDNDCDGKVDEDLSRACSTACGAGTETCKSGAWTGCDAPQPQTEICDGDDNDCDGEVDEADNLCQGGDVCEGGECQPPGGSDTGYKAGCTCDTGSTDPSSLAPFALLGVLLLRRRRRA